MATDHNVFSDFPSFTGVWVILICLETTTKTQIRGKQGCVTGTAQSTKFHICLFQITSLSVAKGSGVLTKTTK